VAEFGAAILRVRPGEGRAEVVPCEPEPRLQPNGGGMPAVRSIQRLSA
jgi:hypothetical protein